METPIEPYMGHWGIKKAPERPNMVQYGKISQPYSQYPVRASGGAVYPLFT